MGDSCTVGFRGPWTGPLTWARLSGPSLSLSPETSFPWAQEVTKANLAAASGGPRVTEWSGVGLGWGPSLQEGGGSSRVPSLLKRGGHRLSFLEHLKLLMPTQGPWRHLCGLGEDLLPPQQGCL